MAKNNTQKMLDSLQETFSDIVQQAVESGDYMLGSDMLDGIRFAVERIRTRQNIGSRGDYLYKQMVGAILVLESAANGDAEAADLIKGCAEELCDLDDQPLSVYPGHYVTPVR